MAAASHDGFAPPRRDRPGGRRHDPVQRSASGAAEAASLPPETFADLAAKVTPAVVNISSTHHEAAGPSDQAEPFDFPPGSPEQFFKHFREQQAHTGAGRT